MLRKSAFFIFVIFTQSLFALSVTPNPSVVPCGMTTVVFSFDCTFTGTVSMLLPSPMGVTPSDSTSIAVNNGVMELDLIVYPSAGSNFTLNFLVVGLDSAVSCAPLFTPVSASFTTNCIEPQNNECANAIELNISTGSCNTTAFNTSNATYSGSVPTCGIPEYLDLFYKFTANNDTVIMEIPSIPGNVGYYGLFDACPMIVNEHDCGIMLVFSGSTYLFTGLSEGEEYYLQLLFIPMTAGTDQLICLHSTTDQPVISCPTSIDVSDTGPNLPNQSYSSSQTISTSGPCTLTGNGIIFDAGMEIILDKGFCTGAFDFEAVIGGCTP